MSQEYCILNLLNIEDRLIEPDFDNNFEGDIVCPLLRLRPPTRTIRRFPRKSIVDF